MLGLEVLGLGERAGCAEAPEARFTTIQDVDARASRELHCSEAMAPTIGESWYWRLSPRR